MKFNIETLATWFGLGRLPKGPGTWGTLGAIPLVYLSHSLGPWSDMATSFVFAIFAMIICHLYEIQTGVHDPGQIVIDEVAGFLVAMVWVPLTPLSVLVGFGLFRFFDILKPPPISWIDRKAKGGVGVVADDLAAGLIANVILQFLLKHQIF